MAADVEITRNEGVFEVEGLKFWALGDRVLIQEDEFKSGYECGECEGKGAVECVECEGKGSHGVKKCSHCGGQGVVRCQACGGKGGLLVAPETAQRRPTTGRVVSLGEACKVLELGQSVMYSNFAGYVVDLARAGKTITIRILHESEVLCGMDGQLQLRNLKGKTEIATFQS